MDNNTGTTPQESHQFHASNRSVVVPVIDIRGGWAVRATAGQRAHYRPWSDSSNQPLTPQKLAEEFTSVWKPDWLYVADLDGIVDSQPQRQYWPRFPKNAPRVLIDAGFRNINDVLDAVHEGYDVILGTESLPSLAWMQDLLKRLKDPNRLWISLDFCHGQWQARAELLQLGLTHCIAQFLCWGISKWIVLDLADVGMATGGSTSEHIASLQQILNGHGWHSPGDPGSSRTNIILAGGGMRTAQDVLKLHSRGVAGVLVATALKTGAITPCQFSHSVVSHCLADEFCLPFRGESETS